MSAAVHKVIPYLHVADVEAGSAFYRLLGLEEVQSQGDDRGKYWSFLMCGQASVMLARASEPVVPEQQAALLYMYSHDLAQLVSALAEQGVVGAVTHPDHMPAGELRLQDPDGYVVLVGQHG